MIPEFTLSGSLITGTVSLLLSLALSNFPALKKLWTDYKYKRESLAGTYFVLAWLLVGLHYAGALNLDLGDFGWPVVWDVLNFWTAAVGAGQLMHTGQKRLAK